MPHGMHALNAQHRMFCTGCCASDAPHWMHNIGFFHMDVLRRMHCIGCNDNDNVVIRYYICMYFNLYNENILLNMLIVLKVKLKANINLAFKNSEKHRQAITLHCITPSLEIT